MYNIFGKFSMPICNMNFDDNMQIFHLSPKDLFIPARKKNFIKNTRHT